MRGMDKIPAPHAHPRYSSQRFEPQPRFGRVDPAQQPDLVCWPIMAVRPRPVPWVFPAWRSTPPEIAMRILASPRISAALACLASRRDRRGGRGRIRRVGGQASRRRRERPGRPAVRHCRLLGGGAGLGGKRLMIIDRGAVVLLNFDPTVGHEQRDVRPCVVVSDP